MFTLLSSFEVYTSSFCLFFTQYYIGFTGQGSNIIYRTDSWRKHPSSFHFTMSTLLCTLAESFYTLPISVRKRKIPSWERASHIFILLSDCKTCPFVASPWVAVGVYMKYNNLGRSSLPYSMKVFQFPI